MKKREEEAKHFLPFQLQNIVCNLKPGINASLLSDRQADSCTFHCII